MDASSGAGGALLVIPDAGGDACIPTVAPAACNTPAGSYCGLIGDGCNGQIDCGNNCPTGWTCDLTDNVCVAMPPTFPPPSFPPHPPPIAVTFVEVQAPSGASKGTRRLTIAMLGLGASRANFIFPSRPRAAWFALDL